jgi:hypothetical protein
MHEYTVWEKCGGLNVKACGAGGYLKYIIVAEHF